MSRPLLLVPTAAEGDRLFPRAPWDGEKPILVEVDGRRVHAALVGFGPVAAGALAAIAVQRARPARCVLLGLAGTFRSDALPVLALLDASGAVLHGIGRGSGAGHRTSSALGFPQAPPREGHPAVHETVALDPLGVPGARSGAVLTVTAASADPHEARLRAEGHPTCVAEDMEAFAVALACRRLDVGISVLRAVSNVAGEDRVAWRLAEALDVLRAALPACLTAGEPSA